MNQSITKVLYFQSLIVDLEDKQVELHLLRSCLGVCKINHLLRTVPSNLISDQLTLFDCNLCLSLSEIIGSSISDTSWRQASLPFCLGGLGLRQASSTAAAAFTASVNLSKFLSDFILPPHVPSPISFPGELISFSILQGQVDSSHNLPDDLPYHSQKAIQAVLDEFSADTLLLQLDSYAWSSTSYYTSQQQ